MNTWAYKATMVINATKNQQHEIQFLLYQHIGLNDPTMTESKAYVIADKTCQLLTHECVHAEIVNFQLEEIK